MSLARTTSAVLAGSARSTACALCTTRKAPPVPLTLSWQPDAGAGVGRDHAALVDLQLRQEDRVDALLEVARTTASARRLAGGFWTSRVVQRVAAAAAAARDRGERWRASGSPAHASSCVQSSWRRHPGGDPARDRGVARRCRPAAPAWPGRSRRPGAAPSTAALSSGLAAALQVSVIIVSVTLKSPSALPVSTKRLRRNELPVCAAPELPVGWWQPTQLACRIG